MTLKHLLMAHSNKLLFLNVNCWKNYSKLFQDLRCHSSKKKRKLGRIFWNEQGTIKVYEFPYLETA